jgi:hypothetical protein
MIVVFIERSLTFNQARSFSISLITLGRDSRREEERRDSDIMLRGFENPYAARVTARKHSWEMGR